MRQFISKLLVVALLFSMMGTNAFIINTNAENNETGDNLPTKYIAPYSSVKSQNPMGACWMFGGISAAESNLLSKTGKYGQGLVKGNPIDLSEAQAVYTFYNLDKDDDGNIATYSSNDARKLISGKEQYLGFLGGAYTIDSAMALVADKGSALEADNPFLSKQKYPDYYSSSTNVNEEEDVEDSLATNEQQENETTTQVAEETTTDNKTKAINTMATKAAKQYKLNRFNIKSAEQLPNIYEYKQMDKDTRVVDGEPNSDAMKVWKKKIVKNGAICAAFCQFKEKGSNKEQITTTEGKNDNSEPVYDQEEADEQVSTIAEQTTNEETVGKPKSENDGETICKPKTSSTQETVSETPTEKYISYKYYHAWKEGDDNYCGMDYRPNYWFFSKMTWFPNHAISIVGFDDNYSRYNFAERLVDPKTNVKRDFDPGIAEIVDLKEKEDGVPALDFKNNNESNELNSSPVYNEDVDGSDVKHAEYIVPIKDGAWIIKNSYSTKGTDGRKKYESGIEHFSYCEASLSGAVSIVVDDDLEDIREGKKKYDTTLTHSSIKGDTWNLNWGVGIAAEVFTIEKDMDIEQIGYWTGKDDTDSRFRIYKDLQDKNNPESGTLVYDSYDNPNSFNDTQFGIHTYGNSVYLKDIYKGYHTIQIKNPIHVEKDDSVSIVVSQKNLNDNPGKPNLSGIMMEKDSEYSYQRNDGDTFICPDRYSNEWKEMDDPNVGNLTVRLLGNATKPENTNTVIVDGKKSFVEDGETFTLPTKSENGYADKDYNTLYAPGQTITVNKDMSVNSIPDIDFKMLKGAAIKKVAPAGIRFVSQATCGDDDLLESNNVTCGTLLTTQDMYYDLYDEKSTLEMYRESKKKNIGNIHNVLNDGWYKDIVGEYSAGIINVGNANWNREFIAQGYVTLNYSNDTQKTIYAGISESRSIMDVAKAIRKNGYPGCNESEQQFIENILRFEE